MKQAKQAGYALGYAAALWSLFSLAIWVITAMDIGGLMGVYSAAAWMYRTAFLWLVLFAALVCCIIVRLFRGKCSNAEKPAALVLTLLYLPSVFGWAMITGLSAVF